MKKVVVEVALLVVLAVVSSISIYNYFDKGNNKDEKNLIDAEKFKKEYEDLNGKQNSYGSDYLKIEIDKDNPIVYSSYEEIKKIITSGTGVIYFGFPECPWCRNAVPQLLVAADNTGLDKIYYLNNRDTRDEKELVDDEVVTTKEGTKEYNELIELLKDVLGEYKGLNDPTIKRLYFPTVLFVKDGKIVDIHVATLPSQTDVKIPLDENQKKELVDIYTASINKVLGTSCDDAC